MESDKLKLSERVVQILATLCICFLACQTGFVTAWPSFTTELFRSDDTVLAAPMTSLQISLLGSLPNIGGLLISPFCSYAFNAYGRKYATMLFGLPFVISWAIISVSKNVAYILLAVTISGLGIAGQNVSMIYISEIAHDSIRGTLSSFTASGYFLGILIANFLAGYLTYMQVVYSLLTMSVLAIVLLMFLKESPVYLVLAGKEKEAAESISFYRRLDVDSKEVEAEIAKIKVAVDPRLEMMLQTAEEPELTAELLTSKTIGTEKGPSSRSEPSWKFLLKSKSSQRALFTVLTVMTLTVMMGCIVLQVYAEPLFKEAVPSLPPNQCAVLLSVDFLIASMVCAGLIDRYGRKLLLTITSLGSGICALILAIQLQFDWAPHWVTALLIYVYGFVYTSGCATIPFVLTAEVFLPEVRSFCNSVTMAFTWLVFFVTLFIFPPLVESVGLGPVFYLFSGVCFAGAIYSFYCVPETKGLSVTEIQILFLKEKRIVKP